MSLVYRVRCRAPAFREGVSASEEGILSVLKADVDPRTMAVDETIATKIGEVIVTSLKRAYDDLKTPANSPATLRQKQGNNPLIDTGEMVESIDYKVHR